MFIDVAAAKEVLTDPGKLNSLVCTVCSSLRSFERFVCYSFGRLRRLYGRSERSLGRSVVCPYGRSVRSFLRSVCSLFVRSVGRLIVLSSVWSVVWLLFGLSFSQHDYIRLFVHLVQCSLFRFFVQSSIRLCSFVIVRVLVLPVVSSSVRFFCSFVCCFHAWLYPPRMLPSEMLLWIMSPPCDENWWRKDWKQCGLKTLLITTSTPTLPPLIF